MTFREWLDDARDHVRRDGWVGAKEAAYEFYAGAARNVGKRWNYGDCIYEREWNLLIVLDACRWDLMAEVTGEYEFVDENTTYSAGSSSGEWTEKNFDEKYAEEMKRTALVTGNPYSETHLEESDFLLLDEVWRYGFDEDVRTIPAEAMTDRAISVCREYGPERIIVHYMQPHHPFVRKPMDKGIPRREFGSTPWDNVWHKLRKGEVDREAVWEGYLDNLRYVLDHVEILLENVNADSAVITSDHGNLLGEFGLYAHPDYVPLPALKRVPWCETTADDTGAYEPDEWTEESHGISVEEQLRHLGYK